MSLTKRASIPGTTVCTLFYATLFILLLARISNLECPSGTGAGAGVAIHATNTCQFTTSTAAATCPPNREDYDQY
jgi:hypothetical protein